MNCSQCGLHIPEGAQTCPNCRAPVRRPGFLERLFGRLAAARPPAAPRPVIQRAEITEQRFQIVDAAGQRGVYHSLEEVPPELRPKIEEALRAAASGATPAAKVRITVKDASGQERTYDSAEDMPAEIRALYERARQNRPS